MTFDEAIKKLEEHDITKLFNSHTIIEIVKQLRQEYAPTVEMTSGQAKTILDPEEGKNLTTLLTGKTPYFDYLFWEPLTDKQVVQAWLHPETIKVVDE